MADQPKQKIGSGHVAAMGRSGLKELSQALPAFPDSNIRPVEEPGIAGNLTPSEIVQGKAEYSQMLDGYSNRATVHGQAQSQGYER